jgi:L-2-hydroxyglutarate oxidase LhgO
MQEVDVVVVGAGAVGLAVAHALALKGRDIIVVEREDAIGTGTSSRNSEVIHAGFYYPKDSLKARLCVEGKHKLYAFCDAHHVDYNKCGKLVVATSDEELAGLAELLEKGRVNGVADLEIISSEQAYEMEPNLQCLGALWSPSTGIFDSHAFMLALQGGLEKKGGLVAFLSPLLEGRIEPDGIILEVGGEQPMTLKAKLLINSAGLGAIPLARNLGGLDPIHVPEPHYARGNYFMLSGKGPFERLIYPMPKKAGLGIHYTRDLGGQARFGPDVEWVDDIDYKVNRERAELFYASIRSYWPDLDDGDLIPGYAGIRPKIQGPGESAVDFVIQGPETHGIPALINLFGIESPGLTSSLAIGDYVRDLVS